MDVISVVTESRMMSYLNPDERLVFVDLETAGLETWRPIIQIAAIAVNSDMQELESFEAKIRFSESVASPESLRKNHYSSERWDAEARNPREVAKDFEQLLRRHATVDQTAASGRVFQVAQLVAHNAAFDGAFLRAWFSRMKLFLPASPRVLCTLQRAIWLFHENKSCTPPVDFKLQTLCQYFDVPLRSEDAHDALADVRATVSLYREMKEIQQSSTAQRAARGSSLAA